MNTKQKERPFRSWFWIENYIIRHTVRAQDIDQALVRFQVLRSVDITDAKMGTLLLNTQELRDMGVPICNMKIGAEIRVYVPDITVP